MQVLRAEGEVVMFTMLKAIFNELASINAMLGSIVSFMRKLDNDGAMMLKNAMNNQNRAVDLYEKAVKEHEQS